MRKLIERKNKKEQEQVQGRNNTPDQGGYFEGLTDVQGNFKWTNKRQSWLGIASTSGITTGEETNDDAQILVRNRKGKCC